MDLSPEENGIIDFVFTGNVGIAQDIGGLIKAVDSIKDLGGFKVHVVGSGSFLEEAKELVKEKQLEEIIIFYGRRPYEEMPKFYKLADVCLATLQADSLLNLTMPSKVQGYMAAGKPDELADAMKTYIFDYDKYKEYGLNGRNYFKHNFTKDIFMTRLYSQLNDTMRSKV